MRLLSRDNYFVTQFLGLENQKDRRKRKESTEFTPGTLKLIAIFSKNDEETESLRIFGSKVLLRESFSEFWNFLLRSPLEKMRLEMENGRVEDEY